MKNALLLLLLFPFASFGQQFPNDYAGTYTGNLHLLRKAGSDSIPCALIIAPTADSNRWASRMIFNYGKEDEQLNDYEWVLDPATGAWQLDEKDGVLITETLIGTTLYATYSVEHMLFYVRTGFRNDAIDYELTVFNAISGLTSVSAEDGTEVRSYPVMTVQKGTFRKKE